MKTEPGAPAFPRKGDDPNSLGGLTKREYFAIRMAVGLLSAGDKVLISKYGGTEIKVDGESYLIMREDDILGIIG